MKRTLACAAAALLLGACSSDKAELGAELEERLGPAPAYSDVAVRYNENVAHLSRVWARATVQVVSRDEDGERHKDQGEGHLQIVRPDRLALQLGKLGDTLFYLGSNSDEYWWFDMLDQDEKVGLHGRHDSASPATVSEFGVPVHPLDLMEVLGVLPLPESGGEVSWSEGGRSIDVRAPVRFGERVMTLDADTLRAERVRLLTNDGSVAVDAELTRYKQVEIQGAPSFGLMIATRHIISVPEIDATITINLYEPTNKEIKEIPFDRARLTKAYRIDRVIDLDERAGALP